MTIRKRVIPDQNWKAVPGFEGFYEVSNCGQVRSLTVMRDHGGYRPRVIPGKILKQKKISGSGYFGVTLWGASGSGQPFLVHRLVAITWIPNPNQWPLVRHLDDHRQHNHVSNLAWGTGRDNYLDGRKNGRMFRDPLTHKERLKLEHAVRCAMLKAPKWYGMGRRLAEIHQHPETGIAKIRARLLRSPHV